MVVQNDCERNVDFSLSPKNDAKKHRLKQRFDVRQKLGQGTYGKVQLAVNKDSGQEVAIKTIKKSKIESEQDLIRIRREIQIMSSIQHPHIIHIYEVFENKDKIVLVMQFASGGELYDYLSEKKVLSDLEARRIFRQIAAAVYYCHKNKICHRDLKLENILLDEKGNAKIADFGLSNVFDERHLLKTYCGSPLYASPEIVKGVPYYGPEVDCWSMGVLLYTLVYGAMPFDGSNFKKLVTQISEGDYFEPKKKSKASDLIHKLLTVSPLKRATIVDICTDNWVNQGYEHSLLQVAEDMANLTPVRLDLLLALAPASPIPTDDDDLREESPKDTFESDVLEKSNMAKDVEDEDEEDDDEEDNVETATNSFAYIRASQASNLSASTPDIQRTGLQEDEDEFLPADVIAALENHCTKRGPERSFDGSISRVSSVAHKSKKPRKSESMLQNKESTVALNEVGEGNSQNNKDLQQVSSKKNIQATSRGNDSNVKNQLQDKGLPQGPAYGVQGRKSISKINKEEIEKMKQENTCDASTVPQLDANNQEKLKPEVKKRGRSPGKIIIPKTFESPQSTPSPKTQQGKSSPSTPPLSDTIAKKNEKSQEGRSSMNEPEDTKNVTTTSETKSIKSDSSSENVSKPELVSEERKQIAKGILKKGIAKAKLAERKLSQQSSTETEAVTPPPVKISEAAPSFFKAPKPYTKEEEKQVQSKAEIVLSPPIKTPDTNKSNNLDSKAPLWDSAVIPTNKQSRNLSWGTVSSTIDSEMNNWREQMEESLRRLSPENEQEKSITSSKADEDEHLVPIARSYKKFTFTKDGACITETKKIYTTPGADGSWTKVEKKTRITTRPGNVEEFEKLRDLHLRNDSPLTKSDSQSSSGSTEVYDDIFDSWTGDTMMCNMMKIKNMFQKFSRDPFLRTERRRNPFRNFHRTESDRGERSRRRAELRSGHSTDKDSSDNDEDYEVSFDSSNPVVYGSQGLWQFLRSSNKRIPRRVTVVEPDHSTYTRSVSQDRSETKLNNWKRTESRASSGYNTGSRSHSRDRTQSPHEKVLRFVFESPSRICPRSSSPTKNESWSFKKAGARHNPRRDSGVGSDGYESEHSYRRVPSDDLSKSGRISPVYNSTKQGLIHDFVKSWPKEIASHHEAPGSFSDTRRHKVEQWLHMNDMNEEDFPFGFHGDPHAKMAARKSSIHDNLSSAYATMRPREFMRYGRSSSDKISSESSADYFSPFDEGPRCARSPQIEAVRNRLRNVAYSPVSEESSHEAHSLRHSDSSHSSSSVHRINFTISDGRVSTSLTSSPQSASRQAQSFVVSPGEHVIESNTRSTGPPVVQMRVSFNHGNRENKILNVTPQAPQVSTGLWQQQESPRNINTGTCNIKETSPVPGIKKFSTEMVHKVGNNSENQLSTDSNKVRHHSNNTSIECEVKTSIKNNVGNKGKMSDSTFQNAFLEAQPFACLSTNADNVKVTNVNTNSFHPDMSLNFNPSHISFGKNSPQNSSLNTPDSLDDIGDFPTPASLSAFHHGQPASSPQQDISIADKFQLDIKPVGVLWNSYDSSSFEKEHRNSSRLLQSTDKSVLAESCDNIQSDFYQEALYQNNDVILKRSPESAFTEIGSIWDQSNNNGSSDNSNAFSFIKEMLSDDGLDNFGSVQFIPHCSSLHEQSTNNISNPCVQNEIPENFTDSNRSHYLLDDIPVIDLEDSRHTEKFKMMPSVMDDLRSPKEVLRHAIRINESLKTCE